MYYYIVGILHYVLGWALAGGIGRRWPFSTMLQMSGVYDTPWREVEAKAGDNLYGHL